MKDLHSYTPNPPCRELPPSGAEYGEGLPVRKIIPVTQGNSDGRLGSMAVKPEAKIGRFWLWAKEKLRFLYSSSTALPKVFWNRLAKHSPRLSKWIANWGWAGLLGAALAIEEAHEYGAAFGFTILGSISIVFSLLHWKGNPDSKSLTIFGRGFGIAISILSAVFGCVWIYGQKGDQPWSRMPGYLESLEAGFSKKTLPPTVPQT